MTVVVDVLSLLLYADLARAGVRLPHILTVALGCHAVRSAMVRDKASASSAHDLVLATSAPRKGFFLPHLHTHLRRTWAGRCHICTRTWRILPHQHWVWAHPCHIGARTRLISATSTPGPGSPMPHLRGGWAHRTPPFHICAGTRLAPANSALDRVHPGHISTGLHRCACVGSIYSLGVYLQIAFFAIIALAASALAIAAHHQSMKCATPLSPSARLQSTLVSTKARLTSCAQLAGRFVGSADRRTHSEFSSLLPAQFGLVPWLLRFAAGRVGRHRRHVRAGPSKRPQPNRSGNRARAPP